MIADEESRLGRSLPANLRQRLMDENGGNIAISDELWSLHPVRDGSSRRTTAATISSIERETLTARAASPELLRAGVIVIGDNDAGDLLLLDNRNRPVIWRGGGSTEPVAGVDWSAVSFSRALRQSRRSTVNLISAGLRSVRFTESTRVAVVIDAPRPGIYVQFEPKEDLIVGEAIGEQNLSRLQAYRIGPRLRERMPQLGWMAPGVAGNWYRKWSYDGWDPEQIARTVIELMEDVYGIDPATLRVSTATF